jgi:cellulose synthase/poly-beta-1,6-N-acetylglucosamine synthase-like glycosyltransferase
VAGYSAIQGNYNRAQKMTTTEFILIVQFLFFAYFIGLNAVYLFLCLISVTKLWRLMQEREVDDAPRPYSGLEPPISILVPAFNEETTIVANLHSLLQLDYPHYEIIVINDGSTDKTIEALTNEFGLKPFPESSPNTIATQPVRGVYRSPRQPNIKVIDKENGGKADSLNAGLNIASSPLFCTIDADSILQRNSLTELVKPFLNDGRVVAAGGSVRLANGCVVKNGFLVKADLPRNLLAMLQIVEYLRAFLFGRMGWVPMNAMLVISGAMGLFDKERVIEVGGYRTDTVGEDMELVVRLHRYLSENRVPYIIAFVPNPVCWTEAPEDLKTLRHQRTRWQRGLCESLMTNRKLLFHPNGGMAGWFAFPFMLVFEMLGPFIELSGYVFMIVLWILGLLSFTNFLIFLMLSIGLGLLLSMSAILLEEMSFHIYPRPIHMLKMFAVSIVDNLGYRQLMAFWRLVGLFQWVTGKTGGWGRMQRSGSWNKTFKERFRMRKSKPGVV